MCEHLAGVKTVARVREGSTDLELPAEALQALYE